MSLSPWIPAEGLVDPEGVVDPWAVGKEGVLLQVCEV